MPSKKIPTVKAIKEQVYNAERLAAVKAANGKKLSQEIAFSQLIKQASAMFYVPVALISLVGQDSDQIISHNGIPEPYSSNGSIDAQPSFCELTVAQNEPVIINDTSKYPTLRLFPSVQHMGVRAHLGIPLRYNNQAIGNFCIMDFKPRQWTPQNVTDLTNLAQHAMENINFSTKSK